MSHLLVLGTDTDAGKTTFCLLWLAEFAEEFSYWKPLETGPSDSARVRALTRAHVHPPCRHFHEPVAPLLAAQHEGKQIPALAELLASLPQTSNNLLIETFGSPFSPLDAEHLQIDFIRALAGPAVLVSSSQLGAIGRTIQCLDALAQHDIRPIVVLLGTADEFAAAQLRQHRGVIVHQLHPPTTWDATGIRTAAADQRATLRALREHIAGKVAAGNRAADSNQVALLARDRDFVWHPYTALADPDPPLACRAAQDEFLELIDGRRVIDGISSWWTILHGHRYPPLLAALQAALAQFDHVHFAGVTHAPAVELAELLLRSAPWAGGRVFYSDNGSTAVEVALKMAYQYWRQRGEPQRTCFIGFEHGYHGDTFGAMAVSRDPIFFAPFEPLLFRAEIVPLCAERLAETLRKMKDMVAAVILEPLVQGAGGMRMHTPETLRDLVRVTQEAGVLFIADEVMTCGRTGDLWAHRTARVAPDLICVAKTLAGGILPLAATLASPQVVAAFDTAERSRTFFHGHSFTAHPVACAVAAANWRTLSAQADPNPRRLERFWQQALVEFRDHPMIRNVRMRGSIAALELDVQGGYLADIGRELRETCLANNVLLRPLGNVLYAMPPLRTSEDSLTRIVEAMRRAVAAASRGRAHGQ